MRSSEGWRTDDRSPADTARDALVPAGLGPRDLVFADLGLTDLGPDDLAPEPATYPPGPVVNGTIVSYAPGYTREVRVGQPVLIGLLMVAGVARMAGNLVSSVVRARPATRGPRRGWKGMRKGPEYLVSPVFLRDKNGVLREVEVHGYFSRRAFQRGDLVRARIRRQGDRELPPRVERIANLTTGQVLTPHPPTLWSHLGPALIVQAVLGAVLLASILLCVIGAAA
jgi:hypothetical protein